MYIYIYKKKPLKDSFIFFKKNEIKTLLSIIFNVRIIACFDSSRTFATLLEWVLKIIQVNIHKGSQSLWQKYFGKWYFLSVLFIK